VTDIADILPMFDCSSPRHSGGMVGEYWAAAMENCRRYPRLDPERDAALLRRVDDFIQGCLEDVIEVLPSLGFDEADISAYRRAALAAFRASLPSRNRFARVH
jgi:hypothetical protein